MARLTEEMVIARSRQSDLSSVKKLNCWGAELGDVSLLRRMPNVEVLALSLNKIRSLSEFAHLQRLRELYVRKNEVVSLSDLRYLRPLPLLSSLWLEDNPCADRPDYRHTVLRNLPRLTRLDNRPVEPEEVEEAQRHGVLFADSDDEGEGEGGQRERGGEEWGRGRPASVDHSPERYGRQQSGEWAEGGAEGVESPTRPQRTPHASPPRRMAAAGGAHSPDSDERYEHPAALTRSYHERSSGGGEEERGGSGHSALRHSLSAHSVKVPHAPMRHAEEYAGSNGDCRHSSGSVCSPPHHLAPAPALPAHPAHAHPHQHNGAGAYHDGFYERAERDAHTAGHAWERDRDWDAGREYPSAVMAEHRGFTRRPVTRNSNLLSAVLCLVKELDYASLEVAEMAVRCRMDELAHGP